MDEKEGRLMQAKMLLGGEFYEQSRDLLIKTLKRYEEDAELLTQLSIVYELLEEYQKSKECLQRALKSNPKCPRARYIQGIDLQNEGKLKEAEAEFKIAIENYPKYADKMLDEHLSEAHTNLGTVLYLQGKQEEAVRAWRLAITYDSENSEAKNNLREFSKKPKEKIDLEEDYEYLMDRGSSLSETGRISEAIKVLEKALAIKPDNALINYNIGLVYGKNGDFDKALKHFEKFLDLDPKHKEAQKIKELVKKIKSGDFK